MSTVLYFDCFSGAAGDMVLGALLDVGVPFDEVRRALGSLAIAPDTVWVERVTRAGVMATKFHVRGEALPADHGHDHHHDAHSHEHEHQHAHAGLHQHATGASHRHGSDSHEHGTGGSHRHDPHSHRPLSEIFRLIDQSALSGAGKDCSRELFTRIAEAEAAIHGTSLDKVHLHEVGALDSVIDIVGAVHALELLRADRIVASPLNVGRGTIRSAHGLYPVPAPATARLLEGASIYAGAQEAELVTPTGALIITAYASSYGPIPSMRLARTGYGAGLRDLPETPNVLRVLIGEADDRRIAEAVSVIEAEIDDMNPQIFGLVMDRLFVEGALDVYYTPIQMKKNRPGILLTVLALPAARERLTTIVFQETTTIGVRHHDVARECLDRETVTVDTPLGGIRVKVARRNGAVMNASPEFDDCVRIAAATGRPLKDVQAAAMKSYLERR